MTPADRNAHYRYAELRLPTGERAICLEDAGAGIDAMVVPERGAIWSAFGVRNAAGERVELLHAANDFSTGGCSPVLFPIVGRSLCDGELGGYRHRGAVLPMPIHGFAKDSAWEVTAGGADAASAFVTCTLTDSPATRAFYPYAFRIALTYRLRAGELRLEAAVANPGTEPLPFHLGYHPYFRAPVLPGGDRRACLLEVPSRSIWELANLCATGERLPLALGAAYDPARLLDADSLDQVFADLRPDPASGEAVSRVSDPASGYTVEMRHDPELFPVFVVYAPREEPFVCLEPWTGLPGGLGDDMPSGKSARRVPPGEKFEAVVSVRVQCAQA